MKNYDFRENGRKRMNSIILGVNKLQEDKLFIEILRIIERSRYLETAQNKIFKLK